MDPIKLIRALIAALRSAIVAHRTDDKQVDRIRAEFEAEVETLSEQLASADRSQDEIDALVGELDEVFNLAVGATPPVAPAQAKSPSQLIREGKAPSLPKVPGPGDLQVPEGLKEGAQQPDTRTAEEKEAEEEKKAEEAKRAERAEKSKAKLEE